MHIEDIRYIDTKSFKEQYINNENSIQKDENNEQGKTHDDKNQIEPLEEHTQRSRDRYSSYSTSMDFTEEENNKKNIFKLGNSDIWACKECIVKGDKWFMKQHRYQRL